MSTPLLSALCCLLLLLAPTAARHSQSHPKGSSEAASPRGTGEFDDEAAQRSTHLPFAGDECSGRDWGTAGAFDLYVLAQEWSPQYCHARLTEPGCAHPTPFQRTSLTIHGLWPQYAQTTGGHPYPQCCDSQYGQALTEAAVQPLLAQLQQYWPTDANPSGQPLSKTLWYHEWAVHGTCSGLDPSDYLRLALQTTQALPTPALITAHVGSSVSRTALEAAYNGGKPCSPSSCMVWLQCIGGYLSEVHTCWNRSGQQIACPRLVVSESGKCTGSTVKINSFGSGHSTAKDGL